MDETGDYRPLKARCETVETVFLNLNKKMLDVNLEGKRQRRHYCSPKHLKLAQLAKACTQENPKLRPSMRSIVVALMTLSSSTED
ncbi:hypothetical protein MKW98_029278 [Papaver atlanticum]|uniref:Uncharacterized protein n=1 Tax=Papaver atlanticum TaxID=357466 RepID=A0AAD4XGB7_9MAGN|nr:hypothetical protein MKW98_029278 [Papaver atlanticum]